MFEPYVIPMGIRDFKFLVNSQEGRDWYDPIKPYTQLEYEWVLKNVLIDGRRVIDAGGHHGHYATIFKGSNLVIVEPFYHNLQTTWKNMELNGIEYRYVMGVVGKRHEMRNFYLTSNGHLDDSSGTTVECFKLCEVEHDANIVKLDVEGAEFEILPDQIDDLPYCDTWIIEIHPAHGDPNDIANAFDVRGFELLKVNREKMIVEPYQYDDWQTHATLIARKENK